MHILWVSEWAQFMGGCERYVYDTATLLQRAGVKNSLLYGVESRADPSYCRPFSQAFPLVDIGRQVAAIAPDVIYIQRLPDETQLDELIDSQRVCVRFYHDHKLFCLREHKYTTIARHSCARPIGSHCYSCLGFINKSQHWPGVRLNTLGAMKRLLAVNRALDGVVVGSSYMKQHVVAHQFDATRIEVIPLYCPDPDESRGGELISSTQPAIDVTRLLFVGQLQVGKGIDLLFQAMVKMQNSVGLDICGEGSEKVSLQAMAERLGIADRVTFFGQQSRQQLRRAYQQARCLVLPVRTPETFCLVGVEAMSYGLAVVAYDVGGIGEWLEDGKTGIKVKAGDISQFADSLDYVYEHEGLMADYGRYGRQQYLRRFKPEYHIENLIAYFRRLVTARASL